ncbi:MAG: transcriptional repressor NrdR [Nitrospirae bacterium]|nr:transcriptional repressor NrdR [Nitrospirota bacterium]
MKCPFCSTLEDKVVDSRLSKEGEAIRRRRECFSCKQRFTTYERVEEMSLMVIKKDGRRETFDRQKILQGLKKACEKRPISVMTLEEVAGNIEKRLLERGDTEIPSSIIGEEVMNRLMDLDKIAYVRFASVYKDFKDTSQFEEELRAILSKDG